MNIIEQRFLRGPNLWSRKCCLLTVADLGTVADCVTTELTGFREDLLNLFPSMHEFAEPMRHGSFVAEVIGQLALELQRLAGAAPDSRYVAAVRGKGSKVRIIVAYQIEEVAQQAFATAAEVVRALCAGENVDAAARVAALMDTARRHAIDPATQAVIDAARARDIPAICVEGEANQIQLGWGARQLRLPLPGIAGIPEQLQRQGEAIVEAMFGASDGRIPVIAVTGTNGKTTTSLMIAHCARVAGIATGVTTTEGIYINGRRIVEGDCAGFHSARMLLTSPEVEFAVLETARGGILKRGLAFDRCTVGVVLNVTADHLGLDGVETLDDLARVKAVVALAASKAVVLNAGDRHSAAMAGLPESGVERIYFAMDHANPLLQDHLAKGGRAAYLQHGAMILAQGARCSGMLDARDMPAALDGHARYNVANALAAAAALVGAGFTPAQIFQGLSSFVSDFKSNPLRSNVYSARGVTIVVDYAHNPAACTALAAMARSLGQARRVAVLTCPGDRRDDELHELGRAYTQGFDELYAYEADPRGRPPGDTARTILEGARAAGKEERMLHAIVAVDEAFETALACCVEGDVLVFACGSSATVSDLVARFNALPARAAEPYAPETGLILPS